ncbi:MAG: hypothetical protein ABSC13_09175 [Dehalococcoidia bacterium]|jgi:hypothetical protein
MEEQYWERIAADAWETGQINEIMSAGVKFLPIVESFTEDLMARRPDLVEPALLDRLGPRVTSAMQQQPPQEDMYALNLMSGAARIAVEAIYNIEPVSERQTFQASGVLAGALTMAYLAGYSAHSSVSKT